MPTAKKYMNYEHGEPFMENGKAYVNILTGENNYTGTLYVRKVRWYSDAEWNRMYAKDTKSAKNYRHSLGFREDGYVTFYYGDTYKNLDWFKGRPCFRYHKVWGWYTPSIDEVPSDIPEGVFTAKLFWEDICNESQEVDEQKAADIVNKIKYSNVKDSGNFIGEIGVRDTFTLTVEKAIALDGFYGPSTMHIMKDAENNTFVWTTSAKTLEVGNTYTMKGTIKDHKEYHGIKQTILTRCTLLKDK